ncbi:hypothetical protein U9M48_001414 [Paspalum notatum var. saurae]|uniref:Uncharacterized protein n=1 Tax=Paspalum notatum var. saurae TaxID=547442 RepID=A0AAQ3PLY4_PASNO
MHTFAFVHSFAYDGIHIDHGIEEQTQEQPLIEEPKDQEPDPQQEEQQQAADFAPEETDPSEEGVDWNLIALDSLAATALAPTLGMEFLICACIGGGACYHQE